MLEPGSCKARDDVTSGLERTARLEFLSAVFSVVPSFSLVCVRDAQGRDAASYFPFFFVSTRLRLFPTLFSLPRDPCASFLAFLASPCPPDGADVLLLIKTESRVTN